MSNSETGYHAEGASLVAEIPYQLLIDAIAILVERADPGARELAGDLASYLPVGVLAMLQRKAEEAKAAKTAEAKQLPS